MTGGVALGLFDRLPGSLRGRLIKKRHSVANRLQAAGPLGRLMHSPKGGSDGSIQSFVVHLRNVGAARYGSIPILDLFIRQKTAGESAARADQLLDEGDIPRVFMTAYSEKNLECMERLAAIEKPMVTGDLLRAIERVIENRSAGPPPGTASGHD